MYFYLLMNKDFIIIIITIIIIIIIIINVSFVHDCDLLVTTFSIVHRSTQTKNPAALPLARLDLSQSA